MAEEYTKNVRIFYCYAHADKALRDELGKHLSILERQYQLTSWYDREIIPGKEWEREINIHLNTAHIVLLLISPDFMASEYCYSIEMKRALERHNAAEACVIPIILRPINWGNEPFGKLQVLPTGGKPITTWRNRDEAYRDITAGVRKAIHDLLTEKSGEQWLDKGKIYLRTKHYDDALVAYEQAIRVEPNSAEAYNGKGEALYQLRRYKEALTAYEQASKLESRTNLLKHLGSIRGVHQDRRYGTASFHGEVGKLFILGLPGSGKTTAARVIEMILKDRKRPSFRIDAHRILINMLDADTEHKLSSPLSYTEFDILDFSVLDMALWEVERYTRESLSYREDALPIIEIARNNYEKALGEFSSSFLQDAYFLYIDADTETCRQRIHRRFCSPLTEDDYSISDWMLDNYYREQVMPADIYADRIKIIVNKDSLESFAEQVIDLAENLQKKLKHDSLSAVEHPIVEVVRTIL